MRSQILQVIAAMLIMPLSLLLSCPTPSTDLNRLNIDALHTPIADHTNATHGVSEADSVQEVNDNHDELSGAITVNFIADGEKLKTLMKNSNESIDPDELPALADGLLGDRDFLGWFYGPDSKYKAHFPMTLLPTQDLKSTFPSVSADHQGYMDSQFMNFVRQWGRDATTLNLVAKFGHHEPANEVEKEGYRLIFQEEFNLDELDNSKWVDRYLSSWSTEWQTANNYFARDGKMIIKIDKDTAPWCREFDDETVVSGFTTGQRNGLHNWTGSNQIRFPEAPRLTHINQYGYYEMRAKGQSGSGRHTAWWLTGFQDTPSESAEIDIFEVLGKDEHKVPAAFHRWNDKDASFLRNRQFATYRDRSKDFHNEWHIYGLDWEEGAGFGIYPDRITLYVDGKRIGGMNVNIDYPMIQLVSLYEKRMKKNWTGPWQWRPYPNTFEIDYVRVYKKIPEGSPTLAPEELEVVSATAYDIAVKAGTVQRQSYTTDSGDVFAENFLPGTKSYARVAWNDGIETQEPVIWDAVTDEEIAQLNSGINVTKAGKIPTLDDLPVTMEVKTD